MFDLCCVHIFVCFHPCVFLGGFFWSNQCRLRKLKRPLLLEGGGAINMGTWFFWVIWICTHNVVDDLNDNKNQKNLLSFYWPCRVTASTAHRPPA